MLLDSQGAKFLSHFWGVYPQLVSHCWNTGSTFQPGHWDYIRLAGWEGKGTSAWSTQSIGAGNVTQQADVIDAGKSREEWREKTQPCTLLPTNNMLTSLRKWFNLANPMRMRSRFPSFPLQRVNTQHYFPHLLDYYTFSQNIQDYQ